MAPHDTVLLKGPDDVGRLALYPDETIHVQINDLAGIVWPQKNFRASVTRKAEKAHYAGEVARVPPMANDIVVEFGRVEEYLERWAHRDARVALAAFDFAAWRQRVHHVLAIYARRKMDACLEQMAALQVGHDHWAAREARYRAEA